MTYYVIGYDSVTGEEICIATCNQQNEATLIVNALNDYSSIYTWEYKTNEDFQKSVYSGY
jgi:hypothetical protein